MADKEVVDLTTTVHHEFSIESSSAKALRRFISEQGLSHNDCTTRSALQARARDALQKRDGSAQTISYDIIEVIPQQKALKRRRRRAGARSARTRLGRAAANAANNATAASARVLERP